ncbi:MAG: hypothetical protein RR588_07905 [Solibacillus sp.]
MSSKFINWSRLDNYFNVLVTDTARNITLEMTVTFWEDEKVILNSWDFVYSMIVDNADWKDGQFIFREIR